jgi:hypothetical protein
MKQYTTCAPRAIACTISPIAFDADPIFPQVQQHIAAERIRALRTGQLLWSKQTPHHQQQGQQEQQGSRRSNAIITQTRLGMKPAVGDKASTPWAQLPQEELDQKLAAASSRYIAMAASMTDEQREREEK